MPFNDLNIAYDSDHATQSHTLSFAKELGYSNLALAISFTGQLPPKPPTVPLSALKAPKDLKLLTRLTLTISDATQNHRLTSLGSIYDIVALRPTDEKIFQSCCSSLECDLISLDLSQRVQFPIKFKTVASALQRGIRFEICYSPGIAGGSDARRNLISGATQLIRATRGRGIVVSSQARGALSLRAPWDVINLAQVWGLPQQRAKEAVCEEAGRVVRFAAIKRTSFRGVADVIDGSAETILPQPETAPQLATNTESTYLHKPQTQKSQTKNDAERSIVPGTKRKAPDSSPNILLNIQLAEDKPISKSAMKRRAKKARLEGRAVPTHGSNNDSKPLSAKQDSSVTEKPK